MNIYMKRYDDEKSQHKQKGSVKGRQWTVRALRVTSAETGLTLDRRHLISSIAKYISDFIFEIHMPKINITFSRSINSKYKKHG